ncbi:MAG: NifB/NifX family molybdenum-iron cluster-binding protein [Sedimentisphaerales bacterium]
MKIAIPMTNGKISSHFGHCEQFAIIDADMEKKTIAGSELLTPPPHEPGLLPRWLAGLSVELVIAGGMGNRAQQLFKENNIDVIVGVTDNTPQELVVQYLNNQLQSGQNICDH